MGCGVVMNNFKELRNYFLDNSKVKSKVLSLKSSSFYSLLKLYYDEFVPENFYITIDYTNFEILSEYSASEYYKSDWFIKDFFPLIAIDSDFICFYIGKEISNYGRIFYIAEETFNEKPIDYNYIFKDTFISDSLLEVLNFLQLSSRLDKSKLDLNKKETWGTDIENFKNFKSLHEILLTCDFENKPPTLYKNDNIFKQLYDLMRGK